MDILELIAQDHRKVEALFSKIENEEDAKNLYGAFNEIYQELTLHAQAEELIFYPALREDDAAEELLEEAAEEHNAAKILLEQMKQLTPTDAEFKTKLEHLKKTVLHHVEEEEGEIFPAAQASFEDNELQALGKQFQETKSKLQSDVKAALTK